MLLSIGMPNIFAIIRLRPNRGRKKARGLRAMENQAMDDANQPRKRRTLDEMSQAVSQCSADMRAWAEAEGYANLKEHIEGAAIISAQGATTLTVLLAGFGGARAGFGIHLYRGVALLEQAVLAHVQLAVGLGNYPVAGENREGAFAGVHEGVGRHG